MKNSSIILYLILVFPFIIQSSSYAQRRDGQWTKKDGKWYISVRKKIYGPFTQGSDLRMKKDKWAFLGVEGGVKKFGFNIPGGKFYVFSNFKNLKKIGPFQYVNPRSVRISPHGKKLIFYSFKGNDMTSNQKFFYVINGKKIGPFTNINRTVKFFLNDKIVIFKAVRDGKFRGRWHYGGRTRIYVNGKEYTITKGPAGFWVESVKEIKRGRYAIKVSIDVGSRQRFKTIYYPK